MFSVAKHSFILLLGACTFSDAFIGAQVKKSSLSRLSTSPTILRITPNKPYTIVNDDNDQTKIDQLQTQNRRTFLTTSLLAGITLTSTAAGNVSPALATEGDMTSQMFNEDGSLKEGILSNGANADVIEAKSTTITIPFPSKSSTDDAIVSADGSNIELTLSTDNTSSAENALVKAQYIIPDKWTPAPEYLDTLLAVREKACDHITIYQVPGTFKDNTLLEKATTIGIAKALNFASVFKIRPDVLPKSIVSADIVSGRKVLKPKSSSSNGDDNSKDNKRLYYEFDLATAPDNCGQSAENLGLGFCPYDTIVLVSATIVNEKMYVCGVTCNKTEWKRANADLKRVRGSFFIDEGIMMA